MKKQLSIILPAYNAAKYLEKCIESIISQTFREFELIIVDDGSIDDTFCIAKKFAELDDRIFVYQNDGNKGVSYTRTRGIQAAECEWISFVDADDYIDKSMFEVLMNQITDDVDMVIGTAKAFIDGQIEEAVCDEDDSRITECLGIEIAKKMLSGEPLPEGWYALWGKIIRKEKILNLDRSLFQDKIPLCYFEDGFILPRIYNECRNVTVLTGGGKLYLYRQTADSLSHNIMHADYFWNQSVAAVENLAYMKTEMKMLPTASYVEGTMLGIMKTYYSARVQNKEMDFPDISEMFDMLYAEYKAINHKNTISRLQIGLFKRMPNLWYFIVGKPYFGLLSGNGKKLHFALSRFR